MARAEGDIEQELTAMYWLVSAIGFYGPMQRAKEMSAEFADRTAQLGLHRLHHHFLGVYLVDALGTGEGTADGIARARQLLAEDPLFRTDEDRSMICVGLAELAFADGDLQALRAALAELATCSRAGRHGPDHREHRRSTADR